MTRFFDLDEANELIPDVRTILESLRDERAELIRLRDQVAPITERLASQSPALFQPTPDDREPARNTEAAKDLSEVRVIRMRMQGVIDQMQAGVARIDGLGITLRDIETGLIDFPALVAGRQVWLCWRLGEDDIAWWHELGDGFGGRQALVDLH